MKIVYCTIFVSASIATNGASPLYSECADISFLSFLVKILTILRSNLRWLSFGLITLDQCDYLDNFFGSFLERIGISSDVFQSSQEASAGRAPGGAGPPGRSTVAPLRGDQDHAQQVLLQHLAADGSSLSITGRIVSSMKQLKERINMWRANEPGLILMHWQIIKNYRIRSEWLGTNISIRWQACVFNLSTLSIVGEK